MGLGAHCQEITVIRRRSGCRKPRSSAVPGRVLLLCCVSSFWSRRLAHTRLGRGASPDWLPGQPESVREGSRRRKTGLGAGPSAISSPPWSPIDRGPAGACWLDGTRGPCSFDPDPAASGVHCLHECPSAERKKKSCCCCGPLCCEANSSSAHWTRPCRFVPSVGARVSGQL